MRILLLGKEGQVGKELQRTLLSFGHIIALGRQEADLQNLAILPDLLRRHAPDVIVNAAAYTAVDKAETDEAAAFKVNAEAVGILAHFARQNNALLVHYSTDYVFDGLKNTPYCETDPTHPQSVYGLSKRAGEEAIQQSGCAALVFRTSWVFSAHGHNFIKTILRLAKERDHLTVVADQYGAPTSAELIADVSALALFAYQAQRLPSGIYHLVASGETNWHDLACYAIDRALSNGIELKLIPNKIHPITSEAYPLPAKRPKNSRMDTQRLSSCLNLELPDWRAHVNRMIDRLTLAQDQQT